MSGITLSRRLVVVLALALLAHTLLMTSAPAHASHMDLQNAPIAIDHTRALHTSTNPTDLAIEFDVHPEDQPSGCDDAGVLTPWTTTGGGERLDRPTSITVVSAVATGSWPMPDEPTHLYPPGVRRAFLQVYRN